VYYDVREGIVMQCDNQYQTVVLAALLHDVGKFIHRGRFLYLDKDQHQAFFILLALRTRGARKATSKTNPAVRFVANPHVMTDKQFPYLIA